MIIHPPFGFAGKYSAQLRSSGTVLAKADLEIQDSNLGLAVVSLKVRIE
jgi:hypothetical protein